MQRKELNKGNVLFIENEELVIRGSIAEYLGTDKFMSIDTKDKSVLINGVVCTTAEVLDIFCHGGEFTCVLTFGDDQMFHFLVLDGVLFVATDKDWYYAKCLIEVAMPELSTNWQLVD